MAKSLIVLIVPGLTNEFQEFNAIYGTATTDGKVYTLGSYAIPIYNVSSIVTADIDVTGKKGIISVD